MNPRPIGLALLCATVVLFVTSLQAQNSQGTILGHVEDSSGAVIPGAKVAATNVNTNVVHHFTTTTVGDYVFVDMAPGPYEVKVDADGFESQVSKGLVLEVDQTLRQNFKLPVGQTKQVVTVTADAQMVQTDNTTTGNVLDQRTIEELPSSGRDFNNLLNLSAGASNVSGGSQVYWALHGLNQNFTEVSVNGARPDSVSFLVDGVADTDTFFSTASNIPSESSIQEVKVQTGLYSAEYGQGSGQINVAIKSGTNQWHGEAYDYFQNDALNPRSPLQLEQNTYEGQNGNLRIPWKQNQFGGTLGGPVRIPSITTVRTKPSGSSLTMAAGVTGCLRIKTRFRFPPHRSAMVTSPTGPFSSTILAPRFAILVAVPPHVRQSRATNSPASILSGKNWRTSILCPILIVRCPATTT